IERKSGVIDVGGGLQHRHCDRWRAIDNRFLFVIPSTRVCGGCGSAQISRTVFTGFCGDSPQFH
ncbi:MAG: hypothetical protein WCF44_01780, partial [Candidatus Methylophosphatis roskildensis]